MVLATTRALPSMLGIGLALPIHGSLRPSHGLSEGMREHAPVWHDMLHAATVRAFHAVAFEHDHPARLHARLRYARPPAASLLASRSRVVSAADWRCTASAHAAQLGSCIVHVRWTLGCVCKQRLPVWPARRVGARSRDGHASLSEVPAVEADDDASAAARNSEASSHIPNLNLDGNHESDPPYSLHAA